MSTLHFLATAINGLVMVFMFGITFVECSENNYPLHVSI